MKKIILLLIFAATFNFAEAQRFGTSKKQNTGQFLNYTKIVTNDITGNDTLSITPNAFETFVLTSVTDSISYYINTSYAYTGDKVTFLLSNSSGAHKILFIGSNWAMAAAGSVLTVASSGYASIVFEFNGTKWVEISRSY